MLLPTRKRERRAGRPAAGVVDAGGQLAHDVEHALSARGRRNEDAEDKDDQRGQLLASRLRAWVRRRSRHDDDRQQHHTEG
ncbi:hypothetical protein ABZ400_30245 [Streptomyces sp. NPDC005897]|uniref:hypothetical protein n=1 Tax=Streptomyces sp. NPDC005897 TaxID=3157081 RepID=UPI0033F637F4